MGAKWKKYNLCDILEISNKKINVCSISASDYVSTDNMIPNFGGIKEAISLPKSNKITEFNKNDILFSNIRTYFKKVWFSNKKGGCSNDVIVFRNKKSIDAKFASFALKNNEFIQYTVQTSKGTKMPRGDKKAMMQYCIDLPPLSEQKSIAYILGSLDNKIELNRKTNKTLEKIAQSIFRSWFIDFDTIKNKNNIPSGMSKDIAKLFPDNFKESEMGLIPDSYKVATLGCLGDMKGGTTPSTKNPIFWDNGMNFWATPKDMSGLRTKIILNTTRKITNEGVDKIPSKIMPAGTVLMSSRAPVGYLAISAIPISINQGFIALVENGQYPNSFILHCLEANMDKIKNNAGGSTFAEISKRAFKAISIVVPPKELAMEFHKIVNPMFQQIIAIEEENIELEKIRNSLMPKLLSGKIRVPDTKNKLIKVA